MKIVIWNFYEHIDVNVSPLLGEPGAPAGGGGRSVGRGLQLILSVCVCVCVCACVPVCQCVCACRWTRRACPWLSEACWTWTARRTSSSSSSWWSRASSPPTSWSRRSRSGTGTSRYWYTSIQRWPLATRFSAALTQYLPEVGVATSHQVARLRLEQRVLIAHLE